jgi:SAM-dependent methyltransferase
MNNVYVDTNRKLWNLWTRLNAASDEYSHLLNRLKAGETTLKAVELEELDDVKGKTLLHLQCHFGLDTLSWAREGAIVTGVDISEEAIDLARFLSQELNIEAEFICSDIYDLPTVLNKQFDIVYTSGGVLCWLSNLSRWAEIVAGYLKPGGMVYLIENHPIVRIFKPRTDGKGKPVEWGYFDRGPIEIEEQRSNGNPIFHVPHVAYYWPHSLGEIVTALCSAGLRLEFLHEFPEMAEERSFDEVEPGRYEVRVYRNIVIPSQFSVRARR